MVSSFGDTEVSGPAGEIQLRFRALPLHQRVRFLFCLHFAVLLHQGIRAAAPAAVFSAYHQQAGVPRLTTSVLGQREDSHPSVLLPSASRWGRAAEQDASAELDALLGWFMKDVGDFFAARLLSLPVDEPRAMEARRIAETILGRMEGAYPVSTTPSPAARWGALIRARLMAFRLPPVASIKELPFTEARHTFVAMLEDSLSAHRSLEPDGVEVLAEALRDIVRAVEDGVDPREAVGWINRALGRPIVVSNEHLHEAIRWGCDQNWLACSDGLLRGTPFSDRTLMEAETRQAPATTAVPPQESERKARVPQQPAPAPDSTRVLTPETTRQRSTFTFADAPIVPGHAGPVLETGLVLEGARRWRLVRQAGQGGMGRVWEAEAVDPPQTRVAVKTVSAPTDANRAALERELRLLRTLQRADYFPVIHDAFTAGGHLHLVMDWVPGRTLDAWVLEPGAPRLDVDRFFHWMEQVADRLAFLHAWPGHAILFRDLKPSNVMYDGDTSRLRLVDFGIGHLVSPDGADVVRAGTEGFMAPEVRRGTIDVRADIFAFGRLGLFLLFGRYDFGGLTPDSRPRDMDARRLRQTLVRACFQLCHDSPRERPSTILAALRHLRAAASAGETVRPPVDGCPTCGRPRLASRSFCPGCGDARRPTGVETDPAIVSFEHTSPAPRAQGTLRGRVARAYEDLLAIRVAADLNTLRCLPCIDVEPYDYQRRAALQVIGPMGGRAMIADDVGLGKTVEAGLVMKEYLTRGLAHRTLLVAPPGLLLAQLCEELRLKFRIDVREYRSNGETLDQRRYVGPGGLDAADHVAVSLRTLSRDTTVNRFVALPWDVAVVDECHHIKSARSKAYRAVRKLVARYTLFMSATPFSGRAEELWAVYDALRPGALGESARFIREMEDGLRARETRLRNGAEQHARTIRGMTIRRRRSEIMVRFPGRQARRLAIRMTDRERQRYLAVVEAAKDTGRGSLAWIQPVLQVSASYEAVRASESFHRFPPALQQELKALTDAEHPKVRAFLERFVDRLPRCEKALVFTHYQASQKAVVRLLQARGRNAQGLLDASTQRRQELLAWFREDPTAEFLVCGKGAGEGLNLQFCGLLVNLDLPWNPMQLEQRIGRIQRLGQPRQRVSIVNVVLTGTIEDRVLEIMEEKLEMFRGTLGDTEHILGEMFTDEGESFESWVAAAVLPDGTLRSEHRADFERRMSAGASVRTNETNAAGYVDSLLGTGSGDGHGGSGVKPPTDPPVSIDFLSDP